MAGNEINQSPDLHDVFETSDVEVKDTSSVNQASNEAERGWLSEAGVLSPPPDVDETTEQLQLSSRLSMGEPSKPLFGRLPLARVVPQDVHSVMDYLDGGGILAGAFITSSPKAKAASWLLGAGTIVTSSLTDYRLSLVKLLPIEAHEALDYAVGVSAISAPFLLGYRKTAPLVAAMHIAIGVGTIVASLFTDYRAYRGAGRRAAA